MNFEFPIAYRHAEGTNIVQSLIDLLNKVLEDNLYDVEADAVKEMIRLRHQRAGEESVNENGETSRHMLLGFALDLPDEATQMQAVVEDFTAAVAEAPPIFHVVKFEDPILRTQLARWAEEMFDLEMKLRRVLTLIYLHAHQDFEPWDLLRDDSVQPMAKEKPATSQMRAAAENQFFHLTFGQYIDLNRRPQFNLPTLLEVIRDKVSYEDFRVEVDRPPIGHEDDAILLAGLKERTDAIERMRNCVAHNRRPNKRVVENYENARPLLDKMLDEYLARWEVMNRQREFVDERGEGGITSS